ncbi:MAG: pyridoxamine 5'-phosphate oxidase family protein [Desulfobacteraceae bacterium]
MNLKSYFDETRGTGIISTSDSEGNVNAAVYGRPHVMEDNSIAFIMRNRLTRKNLESNPKAAYLFIENTSGYKGKRLYLKKIREEQDNEKINAMKRRSSSKDDSPDAEGKFLVYFSVEKELPLIGPGDDI